MSCSFRNSPAASPRPVSDAPVDVDAKSLFQAALSFILGLISPRNRKATIVLCYSVFALTLWKYLPPSQPFADPETGRCVLSEQTFENDAVAALFFNAKSPTSPSENKETTAGAPNAGFNKDAGANEKKNGALYAENNALASAEKSEISSKSASIKPLDGTLSSETTVGRFLWGARKHWSAFLLMGVFPMLIVKFVFREKLSDYGVGWGDRTRTIRLFLTLTPILLIVGWLSGADRAFYTVYPYNPAAGVSWATLILHSIFYFCLYYFAWEFMFRGFLLRGLAPTTGWATAVWIQVVISTAVHYGHPASETFGCVAGGLLWGFLAFRARSIFAGWGQHAALGIALDWSLILGAC